MKNMVFPHKFWRPFLDCMPQLFFRPPYVWIPVHLKGHLIPLCYETLVVNWQNWLFTLFHQSRSVLSPNPIDYASCFILHVCVSRNTHACSSTNCYWTSKAMRCSHAALRYVYIIIDQEPDRSRSLGCHRDPCVQGQSYLMAMVHSW